MEMSVSQRQIIQAEASAVLQEVGSAGMRLYRVCDYLRQYAPGYDWVGFYLALSVSQLLVLGPFSGPPTERLRIPYGCGVCGEVVRQKRTIVLQDVATEADSAACGIDAGSKIAVPVVCRDELVGVFDVCARSVAAIGDQDRLLLEALAAECSELVDQIVPRD